LVVLDGTNHSLPYFYQHNGMDSNDYNIRLKIFWYIPVTVELLSRKKLIQEY
jgi:hypothetical protein